MLPAELTDMVFMLVLACSGRAMRGVCRNMRLFVDARVRSLVITVLQADNTSQLCVTQLARARDIFSGLNKLTIGTRKNADGTRKCLEGNMLTNLLSVIPRGMHDVTIHNCRLSTTATSALVTSCVTRLHLELELRGGENVQDQIVRQVGPLSVQLRSLLLLNKVPNAVLSNFDFLSMFTSLDVLSMPGLSPRNLAFLTRLTRLVVFKIDSAAALPASLKTIELCDPRLMYNSPPKFVPDHVFMKTRVFLHDNVGDLNMFTYVTKFSYWHDRGAKGLMELDLRMELTTKLHFIPTWFKHMEYAACIRRLTIVKTNVFTAEVMSVLSLPNINALCLLGVIEVGALRTIRDAKRVMPHCELTIEKRNGGKTLVHLKSKTGDPFGKACRDMIGRKKPIPSLTMVVGGRTYAYPLEELVRLHNERSLLADGRPAIKGRFIQ